MNAAARMKPGTPRPRGYARTEPALNKKKDHASLHDEADLVNYRADAFARFVSNQDYLENVTSKPIHVLQIAPPPSFPVHSKTRYSTSASDDEVSKALSELNPTEIYFGDLRLMQAKERALGPELEKLQDELRTQTPETVFAELPRFQKQAVAKLTQLLAECESKEDLEKLEEELKAVEAELNDKYNLEYTCVAQPHKQYSIPVEKLAPELKVTAAPENYNPRLIMSFIDMDNNGGNDNDDSHNFNGDDYGHDMLLSEFMHSTNSSELQRQNTNYHSSTYTDTFGNNTRAPNDNNFQLEGEKLPALDIPATGGSSVNANDNGRLGSNDADVNMDDLNQFLSLNGNDEGLDDMDALMNFDLHNDKEGSQLMDNDNFDDDFLLQMKAMD